MNTTKSAPVYSLIKTVYQNIRRYGIHKYI